MKKLGFTLSETLIVMCVLGVIVVLTVAKSVNFEDMNEKKILSISQNFYSNAENTFQQVLFEDTDNNNITKLHDINNDKEINSADLRDAFLKYIDGEPCSCSELINNSKDYILDTENSSCAVVNPNIVVSYTYDSSCSSSVLTKEYFDKKEAPRSNKKSCGSIIYGLQNGKGFFDYDIFAISLGKRGIKTR